jgi:exodeoxyribonuclease X
LTKGDSLDLCTPPLPIKFDAMAIHHITPKQIEGTPPCIQTEAFKKLESLNTPENVLVIQNAEFDLKMLAKEGFESKMRLIDTFRILRAKRPRDTPHGLQHKRYQYGLYKKEQAIIDALDVEVNAHNALGDVIVLKNLFDHLLQEYSAEEMIALCSKPILLEYMPFGKHKGERIEDVALSDRGSLDYMLANFDLDEDVRHSLQHWLEATKERVILTIGFGKYKGMTPEEVAQNDPQYLEWMYNKAERLSPEMREAIGKVLEARA